MEDRLAVKKRKNLILARQRLFDKRTYANMALLKKKKKKKRLRRTLPLYDLFTGLNAIKLAMYFGYLKDNQQGSLRGKEWSHKTLISQSGMKTLTSLLLKNTNWK